MNLEAIALRRAEEQMQTAAWRIDPPPPRPKPTKKGKGRPITCECGKCRKCRGREWARRDREKRKRSGMSPRICIVEGCRRHVHTAGRCWRHAQQFKRWGQCFPNRRRVASPEFIERVRAKLAEKGVAA